MFAAGFFQIPPRDGHPCLSGWTVPTTGPVRDLHPLADIHASQTEKRGSAAFAAKTLTLKEGGYLLSRIALQYHRRKRA